MWGRAGGGGEPLRPAPVVPPTPDPSPPGGGESEAPLPGAGGMAEPLTAGKGGASTPSFSPIRRVSVLNSISLRKPSKTFGSGSCTPMHSMPNSTGTSCFKRTSSRLIRACSANSISFSRRFGCLISCARASSVSRSPYSLISSAAVFTPIPGTPGTLSVESPASDCTSTTLSGGTPNFSITSSRPILLFFMLSSMTMPGSTSCIRSLSEDTIVTSPPLATTSRA